MTCYTGIFLQISNVSLEIPSFTSKFIITNSAHFKYQFSNDVRAVIEIFQQLKALSIFWQSKEELYVFPSFRVFSGRYFIPTANSVKSSLFFLNQPWRDCAREGMFICPLCKNNLSEEFNDSSGPLLAQMGQSRDY